ncbi:hypothetical protein N7457_000264 [Penicillium paradoxum]|uniref:uncharacterized protein n=1 Tax=Penicillium paradoxum TaxID=176176 RepID=UPI0025489000|nr:uncharacterized protein N7457_000264 [Penicillium paradoxum]KAJ5793665.1 hypothetical protein N7457_000264 [Penicillium paradoxum]
MSSRVAASLYNPVGQWYVRKEGSIASVVEPIESRIVEFLNSDGLRVTYEQKKNGVNAEFRVKSLTDNSSRPGFFIHTGAWYDDWEAHRRNPKPYDWAVVKLGGNYGEKSKLQATYAPEGSGITGTQTVDPSFAGWKTLFPASPCGPSQWHGWKFSAEVSDVKRLGNFGRRA